MKDSFEIRLADIPDWEILQQLGRTTFAETYADQNTPENLAKYLEEGFSKATIKAELSNPSSLFYLILHGEKAIAYLKINFAEAQTELNDPSSLEIERIYVDTDYKGNGLGTVLLKQAIIIGNQKHLKYVWLGVWEKNPKAIKFYQKNGFTKFGEHIFTVGDDDQKDWLMKLEL